MNKVMRAVATKNWSKSEKYLYHGYKVEITGEFTTRKVSGLRVVDAWEVVMMEGPIKGSALWFKKDELEEISDGEDADGGPDHLSVLRTASDHPDEAVDGDLP